MTHFCILDRSDVWHADLQCAETSRTSWDGGADEVAEGIVEHGEGLCSACIPALVRAELLHKAGGLAITLHGAEVDR